MNFHEYLKKKKQRKIKLILGMLVISFFEILAVLEMRRSAIVSAFCYLNLFIICLWQENIENLNEKDHQQIDKEKK